MLPPTRGFPEPVRERSRIADRTQLVAMARPRHEAGRTPPTWVKHHKRRNYAILGLATVLLVIIIIAVSSIPPYGVQVGQKAPDFSASDINNNPFQLAAKKGTPVLLEFMATSCGACASQAPILSQLYPNHKMHVEFVSISIDPTTDQPSVLSTYATTHNSPWTWIRDTSGVGRVYGVTGTPTIFLVDGNGIVRNRFNRVTELQTLDQACQALL